MSEVQRRFLACASGYDVFRQEPQPPATPTTVSKEKVTASSGYDFVTTNPMSQCMPLAQKRKNAPLFGVINRSLTSIAATQVDAVVAGPTATLQGTALET